LTFVTWISSLQLYSDLGLLFKLLLILHSILIHLVFHFIIVYMLWDLSWIVTALFFFDLVIVIGFEAHFPDPVMELYSFHQDKKHCQINNGLNYKNNDKTAWHALSKIFWSHYFDFFLGVFWLEVDNGISTDAHICNRKPHCKV